MSGADSGPSVEKFSRWSPQLGEGGCSVSYGYFRSPENDIYVTRIELGDTSFFTRNPDNILDDYNIGAFDRDCEYGTVVISAITDPVCLFLVNGGCADPLVAAMGVSCSDHHFVYEVEELVDFLRHMANLASSFISMSFSSVEKLEHLLMLQHIVSVQLQRINTVLEYLDLFVASSKVLCKEKELEQHSQLFQ
jgi:hypothetical protein